jgi:hypothetical protein
MSDSVLLKVAEQIPFAVILFGVILVFLRYVEKADDKRIAQDKDRLAHEKEMEILRINSAKERETEKRESDRQTNNMWANSFREIQSSQQDAWKELADQMKEIGKAFSNALDEHDKKEQERYKSMNITQDLLEAAKDQLRMKRRSE